MAIVIVVVLVVAGVAVLASAFRRPRATVPAAPRQPEESLRPASDDWTREAAGEFAGLSEAARCDLVLAMSALDDARSGNLLRHALDDPSTVVSCAAAHALVRRGERAPLDAYLSACAPERASELRATIALLE
jgi:hypothetical protein